MDEEKNNIAQSGGEAAIPSERSRWIAAISYMMFFCFFSLWKAKEDPFIKYHARQGFLLLLGECIILILTLILDQTIGRLRLIGVLIVVLIQLVAGLGALLLSVLGFVKALFGEYWHLPLLGDYRENIPGLHNEDK